MDWDNLENDPPKQTNKKWKHGNVYVLDYGDGQTFKIGMTTGEVDKRIKQITSSTVIMPIRLVMECSTLTNCHTLEQLIHMNLDDCHVSGEWFKLDFMRLVEVYDMLKPFGHVQTTDHWFDLVPDDVDRFMQLYPREVYAPFMTREAKEEFENYDFKSIPEFINE